MNYLILKVIESFTSHEGEKDGFIMQFVETRRSITVSSSSLLRHSTEDLIQVLITGSPDEIARAAESLATSEDRRLPDILAALAMGKPETRRAAAWILGEWGDSEAEIPLIAAIRDTGRATRQAAIYALGQVGAHKALTILEDMTAHLDGECAEAANRAKRLIIARNQIMVK